MLTCTIEVQNMAETTRCTVCGKPVELGDTVAEIEIGTLTHLVRSKSLKSSRRWGTAHASCFYRAMPSPKAALSEIRRLAKTNGKTVP